MTINHGQTIKVVHFCRSPVGGLFRHVRDLIRVQAESGLRVGLICDEQTGGEPAVRAIEQLTPWCALGVSRLSMHRAFHWNDAAVLRAAGEILRAIEPDIVHGHGAKGGAYGRLLARRLGARSVYTPHGGSLHYSATSPAGLLYLGLERVLKRHTDGLIFESQFSADTYARKIGSSSIPCAIIHNGLNNDEFRPLPPGDREYDFVFVGELRKLKGIDVLLEATRLLARQRDVRVLIVGDGPDADYFRSRVQSAVLAASVSLSPPVFPATQAFARADCVIVPSLAESFPYIVLEAAGIGIPLLASRIGGIPEIFGPHADRLVPPNNPDALADAMASIIDNPERARIDSAQLQKRVASLFRIDNMVAATGRFYGQVLGRP